VPCTARSRRSATVATGSRSKGCGPSLGARGKVAPTVLPP
jgi:hypothetical protein